jgi:chromosome segregation ATPase
MAEAVWNSEAEASTHDNATVAMSEDDFAALEERVLRAVELVRRERQARSEAEERVTQAEGRANQAETQLGEKGAQVERLEGDIKQLRAERDQVRQRVERLLKQLDALEL